MRDMSTSQAKRAKRLLEVVSLALAAGHLHATNQLPKPITLTRAWISPDNKHAKIYFMVTLGTPAEVALAEKALMASTHIAQAHVGKALKTFSTPRIQFIYDELYDDLDGLNALFRTVV